MRASENAMYANLPLTFRYFKKYLRPNSVSISIIPPLLVFALIGKPHENGFFCGDESINRPYHSDTVPTFILYIMGAAPIIVIFLVEGWINYRQMKYMEKYYLIPSTILHHHQ